MSFDLLQWVFITLIFLWAGFVRTGIGFGGAALGLPLFLLVGESPVFWLPLIGIHLLFFSSLNLTKSVKNVEWVYLKKSLFWILPPTLLGVVGLISLSDKVISIFIYCVTIFYAIIWIKDTKIVSSSGWVDKLLLLLGGYVAGTSLTGAPMLVAVYVKNIAKECLRPTLFVLWFVLVSIKMVAFLIVGVAIHWKIALLMLPVAAIGHFIGLRFHDRIMENDRTFKQWIGTALFLVSSLGLVKIFLS